MNSGVVSAQTGFFARRDPATDLVLALPVLIVYNLGLFLTGFTPMNGVDFVTRTLVGLLGVWGFFALNLGAAAALVVAARQARRASGSPLRPQALVPVLLEGLVFGLLMGTVILAVMRGPFSLQIVARLGPLERFVGSLGAGFFEEVVFRLLLFTGLAAGASHGLGLRPTAAVAIALCVSSATFSLVHYVGPGSDPFEVGSFTYRFLAGVYLGLVYRLRGFAVAVYAHAFYDVHVLVL